MSEEQIPDEASFEGNDAAEFVGKKETAAEAPKAPFVKKAELKKAFTAGPKDLLVESRDREVQLANMISQQSKLIEAMQTTISQLQHDVTAQKTVALTQAEMLKKTGVRKEEGQFYSGGPTVTPPSEWNIPSRQPVIASDEEGGHSLDGGWVPGTEAPTKVRNPHRLYVRLHDLKMDKTDKEDVGYLVAPFEVVDLAAFFDGGAVKMSRGLRHALAKGMLVAAGDEENIGIPENEPDSVQKRMSAAIGRVPRRGKIVRDPKTGKISKETGINDRDLEAAAQAHVGQITMYDLALAEQREFEEGGHNIV